jgi:ABC-type Fe3+-siderophore transport system, permease component
MAVTAFVTLKIDIGSISLGELFLIIFDKHNPNNKPEDVILIWKLYIPRIVSALLAGFALGVAGAVMQCVLRNPLGSPYTLGVSSAAAFGASLGIVVLGGGIVLGQSDAKILIENPYIVAMSAFLWAIVATMVIVLLVKRTKISPETMVLAGVAISSIFGAGISALQYIFSDVALSSIVFWQFGSLGKANWNELGLTAVVAVIVIAYFFMKRWDYNALGSGPDVAKSLGIDVDHIQIITLIGAALITALVVSFMGIIAFVGLLGPHIIRMLVGNDYRYLIPGSMALGALILLIADCVGQNMFTFTLPVGIITSFLGGPLFLYLLIKGYRRRPAKA